MHNFDDEETCEFDDVSCVRETENAILCVVDGEELWFPKSQLAEGNEVAGAGDVGTLVVTRWIAEQKELA